MNAFKKPIMALLVALFVTGVANAKGINFENLSLQQGLEKAKKENKKVFIDVYATWCGPCKYLSKSVFTDDDLGKFMNENFICLKLDGEKADGESLMIDFDLNSYPTMLFLSPEKEMLKKIVGAVSAEEINHVGNGVLNPESTKIYKLQTKYDSGSRDKAFMLEFITEILSEGNDAVPIATEYLELFPNLNLEDEDEFLIFYLTSDALDNELVIAFMANAKKYSKLHSDLAQRKVDAMIGKLVRDAISNDERASIKIGIAVLYDAYQVMNGSDAYSEEELVTLLEEYFDEQ